MGLLRIARDIGLNSIAGARIIPISHRWRILRMLGLTIEPSFVRAGTFFGGTRISIGRDTFINEGCYFDNSAPVSIGTKVDIGPRVMVITGSHDLGSSERRAGPLTNAPVTIEDGAWIGADTTILPGVTIGTGAVVGAGSLVLTDVRANTTAYGRPAREHKTLS
ncbi:DapH/DapD/GlmU-related protein [Frigoribacterium sp. CFBP9030]|uniref:DapH/DapD/GlmU-related protein n=1 Tax=Frigoribacterium sp. CFBP9030 TaxID=3096537 RepID=UPI002A6A377D|nr:DapH/DapD/GlmU-related protein [Frigoribacterium sp. CFBP9030]MDY0892249.1 DapH/DapD/GlmU-related protein [Frigoribacterium sp. CFBP9030]